MNVNERNSIKKYNNIAETYDSSFDGKFTAKFKKQILELCDVSEGEKVLDVGCGNGSLISAISQKNRVTAYGVDISPNMIEECRRRNSQISFQVSSGEILDFANDFFDLITICCSLHHLNNPMNFFKESQRVLKTGGTLIVGEPLFPTPIRKIADWIISPLLKAGDNNLFSHKTLKQHYEYHGFTITHIYAKNYMQIVTGRKL